MSQTLSSPEFSSTLSFCYCLMEGSTRFLPVVTNAFRFRQSHTFWSYICCSLLPYSSCHSPSCRKLFEGLWAASTHKLTMHLSGSWAPQVFRKRGQGLALRIPCMGKQKSAFRAPVPSSAKAKLVSPSNLPSLFSNLASICSNLALEICWIANAKTWI